MRKGIPLLLLAGLAAGCSGGSGARHVGQPGTTATTAVQGVSVPSGIVAVGRGRDSPGSSLLVVYDPASGAQRFQATLPVPETTFSAFHAAASESTAFNRELTRFAWVADCELHAAQLAGDAYTPLAGWAVAQSFSRPQQCYRMPRFRQDGRIQALVVPAATPASLSPRGRVVSVDPASPGSPAHDEGTSAQALDELGRPATPTRLTVQGSRATTPTTLVASNETLAWAFEVYAGEALYDCPDAIDATTLLCWFRRVTAEVRPTHGALAALTADRARRTVTLRRLAHATGANVVGALASPDGREALVAADSGWYRTTTDGNGEVRAAFPKLQGPPDGVEWAPTDALGPTVLAWR